MKKPYIKKYCKISKFSVFIVDGAYIREFIDEEFTNFGQHFRFKFIPKNEFWIDKQNSKDESKYYIGHLLVENRLMSQGKSYDYALEQADKKERLERIKSKHLTKLLKRFNTKKKIIGKVHKKLIKNLSGKIKIWIVHGYIVRSIFFVDFTEGGHGNVYDFIPHDEVWIDDELDKKEINFVIVHELHERYLMSKGLEYDLAHHKSSNLEYYCRHNKKELKKILQRESRRN
ncbi:hypothetical protein J4416_01820 [Candidatus Pacearchaeota archaeon]|nr:hypothetical protein [Candidatus Pacearchaeota archaeon]